MAKFFRKAWPHLLIVGGLIVFILVAPRLYSLYFIKDGKPVAVSLPTKIEQAKFNLETLVAYDQAGTFKLEGWAFLLTDRNTPVNEYERQVVLVSGTEYLAYPTLSWLRADIVSFFDFLEMDLSQSGFSALISRNSLKQGIYNVGITFRNPSTGQAFYVETGRCIRRTPNQLILEPQDSPACDSSLASVSSTIGIPLKKNISLPAATEDAEYWVDRLESYNDAGVYALWGWDFIISEPVFPAGDYTRQVVLISETGNYVFSANSTERTDVQEHFSDLGLDLTLSGFWALIASDVLEPGSYLLGLILEREGNTYFIDTGRCITYSDASLVLEEVGSTVCKPKIEVTPVATGPGSPIFINVALPPETQNAKFWVDHLQVQENEIYQIWGWVFLTSNPEIPAGEYVRQIVLSSGTGNYLFSANTTERPDIQEHFSDLGMDLTHSGFWTIISADALELGSYSIELILQQEETAYLIRTNRCITRSVSGLVLEDAGSTVCIKP